MLCEVPRHILMATDLGPASGTATRFAGELTSILEARLTLYHAVAPMLFFDFGAWDAASLQVAAERQMERAAVELRRTRSEELPHSLDVDIEVREVNPVQGILELATSKGCDLIVLGTHAWGPVTSFFLGSVTQGVLHQSDIPVLTVRPRPGNETPRIRTILCPVDLSDLSRASLEYAARLAAATGASLELIHLVEPDTDAARLSVDEWIPSKIRAQNVRTIIHHGHPAEEVVSYARNHEVDLIVIGARHRRFVDTTVLGTTTERVVRHADCAVMAVTLNALEQVREMGTGVAQ